MTNVFQISWITKSGINVPVEDLVVPLSPHPSERRQLKRLSQANSMMMSHSRLSVDTIDVYLGETIKKNNVTAEVAIDDATKNNNSTTAEVAIETIKNNDASNNSHDSTCNNNNNATNNESALQTLKELDALVSKIEDNYDSSIDGNDDDIHIEQLILENKIEHIAVDVMYDGGISKMSAAEMYLTVLQDLMNFRIELQGKRR